MAQTFLIPQTTLTNSTQWTPVWQPPTGNTISMTLSPITTTSANASIEIDALGSEDNKVWNSLGKMSISLTNATTYTKGGVTYPVGVASASLGVTWFPFIKAFITTVSDVTFAGNLEVS